MSHLLDTTTCIPLLNGEEGAIRSRFDEVLLEGARVYIPSIVSYELWYGVSHSAYPFANHQRLIEFFNWWQIEVIDFALADSEAAGAIRAALEIRKQPIGPMDTLIAGQAVARGLTLITHNVRELSRVDGLSWEDWT